MSAPSQPTLPEQGVAHCIFCDHTETFTTDVGRSDAMEDHYRTRHRSMLDALVGRPGARFKKSPLPTPPEELRASFTKVPHRRLVYWEVKHGARVVGAAYAKTKPLAVEQADEAVRVHEAVINTMGKRCCA